MSTLELFAIALALSLDAFAVAVATGFKMRCTMGQTLRMGGAFGFFQFLMPSIGWLLGITVREYIEDYDHWVSFILLACVGLKMLKDSWSNKKPEECTDPTTGFTLILLAVATSIDALAIGISLALLNVEIWYPAAVIGLTCFAITAVGMHIGRLFIRQNSRVESIASAFGGLVLIGIGVNILREHGVFDFL